MRRAGGAPEIHTISVHVQCLFIWNTRVIFGFIYRRSRDNSRRGSVLDLLNAPSQGFMTASAPGSHCGSRRGSNAGIFIEPEQNPESYGRIFFIKKLS